MLNLNSSDVLYISLDNKYIISDTDKSFLDYVPNEQKSFISKYLKGLTKSVQIVETKLQYGKIIYTVFIEGFKNTKINLRIYKKKFFVDNNDFLTSNLHNDDYFLIYNFSFRKIELLKKKEDFLVLNNISKFDMKKLASLKVSKQTLEKIISKFILLKKDNNQGDFVSEIIKVNIYQETHYYKINLKYHEANKYDYAYISINNVDDVIDSKIALESKKEDLISLDLSQKSIFELTGGVFIREILDMLLNTNNILKSIEHVLERLLRKYGVERIIYQTKIGNSFYQYIAAVDDAYKDISKYRFEYDKYESLYDTNQMMVVSNRDLLAITSPNRYELYSNNNIYSQVTFNLSNDTISNGFISFEMCSKPRNWTEAEQLNFSIIAKIISSFNIKLYSDDSMKDLVYKDSITLAWNVNKLKDKIREIDPEYTILLIDFKNLNLLHEKFGYEEGDRLLKTFSDFLIENKQTEEYFSRINDSNFVIIMYEKNETKLLAKFNFINNYVTQLCKSKYNLPIEVYMGIHFKQSFESFTAGLDKATKAMKKLNPSSQIKMLIYSNEILEEEQRERMVEANFDQALVNNEFVIYLQPCFNLKKKTLHSAEALVRWETSKGLIFPDKFIPILERNRKIIELDFCVYENVCKYLVHLKENKHKLIPISVNVSRLHISSPDFSERFMNLLSKYDLSPENICLEITESVFDVKTDELKRFVQKLRELGFKIYIDDFGVAYSNISCLGQITADVLKLDKSFLDHEIDKREMIILESVVKMAKNLGMEVVCEGIEGKKELQLVQNLKCEIGQGYYYDKPLPLDEFHKKYVLSQNKK